MRCAAGTCRGVVQFPGVFFGQRDQVLQAIYAEFFVDHQHVGLIGHDRYEGKVANAVIRDALHQRHHHVTGRGADQQRVSVRLGARDKAGADGRSTACLALNNDRLFQARLKLFCQASGQRVGRSTRMGIKSATLRKILISRDRDRQGSTEFIGLSPVLEAPRASLKQV